MEILVQLKDISKRFGHIRANNNVNITLYAGETHALVGENGAGKSTLMKILYGQYTPDDGKIIINGHETQYDVAGARAHGIGMVYQNFMQIPELSIMDNIILGNKNNGKFAIDYKSAEKKVASYLQRFKMKVSPQTAIKKLSVGERQRIEIIKALYFGAKILILDEPTAVLTPQETEELFIDIERLKSEGCAIVFISHKLREVITVGDRFTVMRKGEVVCSDWVRGDVDEVDIARAMIGKNEVALLQNDRKSCVGSPVLKVNNLWYFDEIGVPQIRDLSFQVNSGEILGIGGVEGNGQTELAQLLIGLLKPSAGEIIISGKDVANKSVAEHRQEKIGFVSEDRMNIGLVLNGTMQENIIAGMESDPLYSKNKFILKRKEIDAYSEKMIQLYDIKGITPDKEVKDLSGGNMQKIILAREIGRNPDFLVAAQPTRGLDIGAINFVRKQLLEQREKGMAILLISADLEELMSLSDRIIILYEGSTSGEITDMASANEAQIGLLMGGVHK